MGHEADDAHPVTVRTIAVRANLGMMSVLSDAEIEQRLAELAGLAQRRGHLDHARVTFEDFAAAIAFVNGVAELAEAANHHPDILMHGWNRVRLTLSTHSQGGLTDADFQLAGGIDRLA